MSNFKFYQKPENMMLGVTVISAASLILALLSQSVFSLYPCTFCIMARFVISLIFITSLLCFILHKISNIHSNLNTSRMKLGKSLVSILVVLNIPVGILLALKHYAIVRANDFSCGVDELQVKVNEFFLAKLWPSMYQATGNCIDANYKLFDAIDYVHLPMLVYGSCAAFLVLYYRAIILQRKTTREVSVQEEKDSQKQ